MIKLPLKYSSGSKTRHSPSYDECRRIRRHCADQASQLKDSDCTQVGPFQVEWHIQASLKELAGAGCEKVGRSVPANLTERVELIGDPWDCDNYYCIILPSNQPMKFVTARCQSLAGVTYQCLKKDCLTHTSHDKGEFGPRKLFCGHCVFCHGLIVLYGLRIRNLIIHKYFAVSFFFLMTLAYLGFWSVSKLVL